MKLLVIPANYPHPAAEWVGAQNERSAQALRCVVQHLEVFAPRPYAPRILAFNPRWRGYMMIPSRYERRGIPVHRPAYPAFPRLFGAFWPSRGAFLFTRHRARVLHRAARFDAILSFDLNLTGGLAWRLGRDLGIPACGWATGSDVRFSAGSDVGRSVREALGKLDLVFYQSDELKGLAAKLLGADRLVPERHVVQSRGVMEPKTRPGDDVRRAVRASLAISEEQVVILYLGRIVRDKGLFELVDGFAQWAGSRKDLVLLLVGANPGHDVSPALSKKIESLPAVAGRLLLRPACEPGRIWEYFRAADVFAFPSVREGMPNSLLEAMLAGLPAVAFSIPPVQEITRFGEGLVTVPPHDFAAFGDAMLSLVGEASVRRDVGQRGRAIVQEHFSAHKSMDAVVRQIRKLVGRPAD